MKLKKLAAGFLSAALVVGAMPLTPLEAVLAEAKTVTGIKAPYSTEAQALATVSETGDGVVYFYKDANPETAPTAKPTFTDEATEIAVGAETANPDWQAASPTAIDAGSYAVYYVVFTPFQAAKDEAAAVNASCTEPASVTGVIEPEITLAAEPTSAAVGDTVTLTATMRGAKVYAGKVQFMKGAEKLEDGEKDLTEGVATYTWTADETATFSAEYVPALGDPLSAATSIAVEVTVEAAPQPEPEPIPAIEPLPDPAADKTPQGEATVEEIEGGTVTTQPNSDGSTTVITETYNPSTGYTNVLTVVTEESGAFASKEIETAPDGSKTIIDEYADASGDNTYAQTIDMDKDGNVTGTYVGSKTTVNGVVTETHEAETAEGKTVYEKVTQANEDFTEKTEVFSPEGLLIQSDESSKETAADGTVTEKEKNFTDGVTAEQTKVTGTDGSSTVSSKLTLVNGDVSEQTVKNDGKGAVEITGSDTLDGQKSEYALSGTENGLTLTKETGAKGTWTVFDVFAADDGKSYPVVALGAGVFENNKELTSLTVGEGIVTFEKGALAGCANLTELNLTGVAPNEAVVASNGKSKSNIKLMKNSLKGTNKKLKIFVKTKADQKAVKKQLKKAGNKKAKVKVMK